METLVGMCGKGIRFKKAVWFSAIISTLSGTELSIYEIAHYMQKECEARGKKCLSPMTVGTYVKDMKKRGMLTCTKRHDARNHLRNYYRVAN